MRNRKPPFSPEERIPRAEVLEPAAKVVAEIERFGGEKEVRRWVPLKFSVTDEEGLRHPVRALMRLDGDPEGRPRHGMLGIYEIDGVETQQFVPGMPSLPYVEGSRKGIQALRIHRPPGTKEVRLEEKYDGTCIIACGARLPSGVWMTWFRTKRVPYLFNTRYTPWRDLLYEAFQSSGEKIEEKIGTALSGHEVTICGELWGPKHKKWVSYPGGVSPLNYTAHTVVELPDRKLLSNPRILSYRRASAILRGIPSAEALETFSRGGLGKADEALIARLVGMGEENRRQPLGVFVHEGIVVMSSGGSYAVKRKAKPPGILRAHTDWEGALRNPEVLGHHIHEYLAKREVEGLSVEEVDLKVYSTVEGFVDFLKPRYGGERLEREKAAVAEMWYEFLDESLQGKL